MWVNMIVVVNKLPPALLYNTNPVTDPILILQ